MIKRLLGKIFNATPKLHRNIDQKINLAFELKGVKYYCFDDAFNVPYERALTALTYYEEYRMRCTREFLQLHVKATAEAINKGSLTQAAILNGQLKERLDFVIEPELLYKLASVIYFDETESPFTYDFKYNIERKLPVFKENKDLNAFFLHHHISQLVPFLKDVNMNLELYSKVVKEVTDLHLERILSNISGTPKKTGAAKG